MTLLLAVIVLAALVTGCGPDPVEEARATRIASEAAENAADRQQERQQQQEEWERTLPSRVEARKHFLRWLSVSTVICIAALSAGTVWFVISYQRARVQQAFNRAGVVYVDLDPVTHQYPLLAFQDDGGWRVHNPNTDGVTALDGRQEPNSKMIAASGAVQLAGTVGRHASRAAGKARQGNGAGAATGIAAGASRPVLVEWREEAEE